MPETVLIMACPWLAAIGPGTSMLEAVATAVAAGIVLGGFVAGSVLLIAGRRDERELTVADMGYCGGLFAMLVIGIDFLNR